MSTPVRDEAVDKLARLARRAPAAGFILNAASQRPDADSVPAKLREIITYRYCTQVVDRAPPRERSGRLSSNSRRRG